MRNLLAALAMATVGVAGGLGYSASGPEEVSAATVTMMVRVGKYDLCPSATGGNFRVMRAGHKTEASESFRKDSWYSRCGVAAGSGGQTIYRRHGLLVNTGQAVTGVMYWDGSPLDGDRLHYSSGSPTPDICGIKADSSYDWALTGEEDSTRSYRLCSYRATLS